MASGSSMAFTHPQRWLGRSKVNEASKVAGLLRESSTSSLGDWSTNASFTGSGISDLRSTSVAQQRQMDGLIGKMSSLISTMHEEMLHDVQSAHAESSRQAMESVRQKFQQLQQFEGDRRAKLEERVSLMEDRIERVSRAHLEPPPQPHFRREPDRAEESETQRLNQRLKELRSSLSERFEELEDRIREVTKDSEGWRQAVAGVARVDDVSQLESRCRKECMALHEELRTLQRKTLSEEDLNAKWATWRREGDERWRSPEDQLGRIKSLEDYRKSSQELLSGCVTRLEHVRQRLEGVETIATGTQKQVQDVQVEHRSATLLRQPLEALEQRLAAQASQVRDDVRELSESLRSDQRGLLDDLRKEGRRIDEVLAEVAMQKNRLEKCEADDTFLEQRVHDVTARVGEVEGRLGVAVEDLRRVSDLDQNLREAVDGFLDEMLPVASGASAAERGRTSLFHKLAEQLSRCSISVGEISGRMSELKTSIGDAKAGVSDLDERLGTCESAGQATRGALDASVGREATWCSRIFNLEAESERLAASVKRTDQRIADEAAAASKLVLAEATHRFTKLTEDVANEKSLHGWREFQKAEKQLQDRMSSISNHVQTEIATIREWHTTMMGTITSKTAPLLEAVSRLEEGQASLEVSQAACSAATEQITIEVQRLAKPPPAEKITIEVQTETEPAEPEPTGPTPSDRLDALEKRMDDQPATINTVHLQHRAHARIDALEKRMEKRMDDQDAAIREERERINTVRRCQIAQGDELAKFVQERKDSRSVSALDDGGHFDVFHLKSLMDDDQALQTQGQLSQESSLSSQHGRLKGVVRRVPQSPAQESSSSAKHGSGPINDQSSTTGPNSHDFYDIMYDGANKQGAVGQALMTSTKDQAPRSFHHAQTTLADSLRQESSLSLQHGSRTRIGRSATTGELPSHSQTSLDQESKMQESRFKNAIRCL